jgi:hypothetical protein
MKKTSLVPKIVLIGTIWGILVLILSTNLEPTPENFTLAASISLSGFYTCFLYLTRRIWLPLTLKKPVRNAFIVGSLNAAVIETLFLIIEKIFGAEGVAAHPNLLVDLLMTMPWYIGMVWIFVQIQKKERFSPAAVLLFGAIYELGADGLVGGQIIPLVMGEPINLVTSWILMLLLAFWQFIPVYSSMVLPPAWILEKSSPDHQEGKSRWARGLLPLLWLIPFTLYLLVLILVLGFLSA